MIAYQKVASERYGGGWNPDPAFGHEPLVTPWPKYFRGSVDFPNLAEGLRDVGFSTEEIAKIMSENWLRLFADGFKPQQ